MNILHVDHVCKRFSGHVALDNVSMAVPEGSVYGLLGPNGAGKTTLIRIINQITGPDEGAAFFNGEKLRPSHCEKIGYLPEERGLYKKMKVGEQSMYLARLKGLSRKDAAARLKYWFDKFGIMAWWNRKIEELSKGMQQKVQFIVTVLHEPRLLILDEPFSGFDPVNATLIRDEILELRKKGATVIFSTHNMGSVEEMCDHIALIHKAKKIVEGPVKDIRKEHSQGMYEISFTGSWMGFTNALWAGAELVDKSEDGEIRKAKLKMLRETRPNDILGSVLPVVQVHGLREIIPTMHDIFISLVTDRGEASHGLME